MKSIKRKVEKLIQGFDDCGKGVGTFSGVVTGIVADGKDSSWLGYALGETSVHWRVEISEPYWGLSGCCNTLYAKWTLWIDDDFDANSFGELWRTP